MNQDELDALPLAGRARYAVLGVLQEAQRTRIDWVDAASDLEAASADPGWPAALAGAPVPTRCSELLPGGTANTPDPVRAGPAAPLPSSWAKGSAGLPRHVYLRGMTATYNRLYEFALADGDLFARRRGDQRWRQVPLPDCLDGQLTAISADDDEMIGHNEPPIGADWAAPAAPTYFNYRKVSIYGGSNEIQRNILAKAVLGF